MYYRKQKRKRRILLEKKDEEERKKWIRNLTMQQSQTDESKVTVEGVLPEYDNIEPNDRALQPTLRPLTVITADTRDVINKDSIHNTSKNKTDPHNNKKTKKKVLQAGPKATHQPMLR